MESGEMQQMVSQTYQPLPLFELDQEEIYF